jgi:hypothetical protein
VRERKPSKRTLPVLPHEGEATALVAAWPEAVLSLSDVDRASRVRAGLDTVLLRDGDTLRGFVRALLRVPLGHPLAATYIVFVEVDRDAYTRLKTAFLAEQTDEVSGQLATRLPNLESSFGASVTIRESGGDQRARIVATDDPVLNHGPTVGPHTRARPPS